MDKNLSKNCDSLISLAMYVHIYTLVRHQNPNKSNNFFKQNVFNEKLNITKNSFTWHLGNLCRAQLLYVPY